MSSIKSISDEENGGITDVSHVESTPLALEEHGVRSKEEKRLLLKQDIGIVPLLTCSFLVAYLDRNNIGNARVMGMQKDLGLTDGQFFNCLMMFFVGYLVFILPANLGMRVIGPPRQLGLAVIFFATCSTSLSAVHNYASVMGLRVLIGMGEAFVQVGLLYFSFWYKRDEVATRASFYYCSATLSGCFSGLVAYAVQKNLDGVKGYHAWQWLYIVEGVPAIALGIVVFFCLPSFPEVVAKKGSMWFKKEELDLAMRRMEYNTPNEKLDLAQILVAFRDPKSWFTAMIYGALCIGIASITSFLPTFISEFGFDKLRTQLFTMIPYAFATVALLGACHVSDRLDVKGPVLFLCISTTCAGYIILLCTTNPVAGIAGACFAAAGIYPGIILTMSWVTINHSGYTKRSTAFGMAQISGQAFSIIGTQVYRKAPRYFSGHGTLLGLFILALCATVGNWLYMRKENRRKDAEVAQFEAAGEKHPDADKPINEIFDYHPNFRYVL